MPETQLPIFPEGATEINDQLAFEKRDGVGVYFHGVFPVFSHPEGDSRTFRMITSQFCVHGRATQQQIVNAFGVPLRTVKRYCALFRAQGAKGFYAPQPRRGPAVRVEDVLQRAQQLLDEDMTPREAAEQLGLKPKKISSGTCANTTVRTGLLITRRSRCLTRPRSSTPRTVTLTPRCERWRRSLAAS